MQQAVDYLGLSTRDYNSQTVLLSATLIAIVAFILSDLFGAKQHDKGPPKVKYWIPVVGHGLSLMTNRNNFLMECKKKYGDVYSILIFGRWITIIGRSEQHDVICAPSEQLNFKEALDDVIDTAFIFNDPIPRDRFHIGTLRKNLAKQLGKLHSRMMIRIVQSFQNTISSASTDYYMKDSYNFVHQMVGKAMAAFIFENEELQTNSEVIRMLCTIANDTDIAASLKMIFPLKVYRWIFRHITAYKKNHKLSSEIFVPEIQRRRDMKTKLGDDYVSSYDMLEWITFTEDPNGRLYDVNIVANRVLEAAFVAVSTTSNNTLHLLFDMASYPDYRKKLQDEQNEIIHRYGNDITDESLRGMTFLDAFVRESLRVNGNAQAVRIALDDVQLKSGYVIPKGTLCVADGREINIAEDLYGPDPVQFNPYHHINTNTGLATKASTVTKSFTIFGAGQYACPGRFLAVMTMKSVAAYALRHYDFSTMSGKRPANFLQNNVVYLPVTEPIIFKTRFE